MMRMGEYERIFRSFDEDGDGKVSAAELRKRLRLTGEEMARGEAEMAVDMLDSDGDGLLSLEDFVRMMEEGAGGEEEKLEDLRRAFEVYDSARCGFITAEDVRRVLSEMGETRSLSDCRLMIEAFDLDGDGVLSFEEFRIMMQ